VFFTVSAAITINGIVTSGSDGTVTLVIGSSLTTNVSIASSRSAQLNAIPSITVNGIATSTGYSTATLIARPALGIGAITITIPPPVAIGFGSTPFGSTPFGADAPSNSGLYLRPTATLSVVGNIQSSSGAQAFLNIGKQLTVGARRTQFGAVSLSVGKTLTVNGTVSANTITTQVGKTSNGASSSPSTGDKTVVSKVTSPVTGVVTAGHARIWVDSGTAPVEMCVYLDNNGNPGSRIALSNALTISNTTESLRDFTFSTTQRPTITQGTDYWIGFTWADPGANSVLWSRDAVSGGCRQANLHAPSSFGTPSVLSGPIDAYIDVVSNV
jgi:hypothetical protein